VKKNKINQILAGTNFDNKLFVPALFYLPGSVEKPRLQENVRKVIIAGSEAILNPFTDGCSDLLPDSRHRVRPDAHIGRG
jgi:hypothetical protein